MGQIFQNFIGGEQAGRESSEARRRQNALEQAGTAYGTGDAEGAENALMSAGLVNEAGAYSALAEARRGRTNRAAISGAMTSLDPNATAQQRAEAGASAALTAGDTEQWAQFTQYANTLTQQDRENQAQRAQFVGSISAAASELPDEQRLEYLRAQVANSPYNRDPHIQALIDDNADDLSTERLRAAAQSSMGAADILAGRERQERYAVQDRQFQQQLGMQERAYQRSLNPDSAPISNSDRRGLDARYQATVSDQLDDLGILRPSLPYARLAVTHGGDTTNISGVNSRSSDVALLRAAARAQTGPGVLTESEVFSTLSPSLQNDLNRQRAYLDISQNGITPQDRLALAQFVMQSARNTQRDVWDLYESAQADWGERPNAPNFEAPRIPHPEDEGRLQSAERGGAQVGREYVANNGRTYTFLGPGSWELSRMDGRPDQSLPWQPNAERAANTGPAPTATSSWASLPAASQQVAIQRVRNGQASMEEFQQTFGLSADEARRVLNQRQSPPVVEGLGGAQRPIY